MTDPRRRNAMVTLTELGRVVIRGEAYEYISANVLKTGIRLSRTGRPRINREEG